MKLKEDVHSNFNNRELYARKGDEVTVISDHENVLIVENKNGFRFSTKKENLTDEDVSPEPKIVIQESKQILKPVEDQKSNCHNKTNSFYERRKNQKSKDQR